MRSPYLLLALAVLISAPVHAMPIDVKGAFTQVQPDGFQGQDQGKFFGVGAIQATGSQGNYTGPLYLEAVGPDGDQTWQLIPLDWQWTMHAANFDLQLDGADFVLAGVGVVNPFGATVVGPTNYIQLSLTDTELTVAYLGWPIARGVLAPVPEPSTLTLLLSGSLMGLAAMAWRRKT